MASAALEVTHELGPTIRGPARTSPQRQVEAPTITLPKGGGAIQGIGEKFQASPATGTGSFTVPIAMSAGRSGFGPGLALSYDSGAGNSPFGLGWSVGLPSITRKTQKGLPRYEDAREGDTYLLAGAEDLVPALVEGGDGAWVRDIISDETYTTYRSARHTVYRYRPRIEGLFARIERWVRHSDGDTHWRSITGDNRTTLYGETPAARIVHPDEPTRVFQWLIERSYDDKGNLLVYEYVSEDPTNVLPSLPSERNRLRTGHSFAQRYLKRVHYGNSTPYLIRLNDGGGTGFDEARWEADNTWHFELVFDYGEHDAGAPTPAKIQPWPTRPDPFSTYRSGFEVRTYRLCRRILMFHRFEELGPEPYLVRSTNLAHAENPVATQLEEITHWSYEAGQLPAPMPRLRFTYSEGRVDDTIHSFSAEEAYELPDGRRRRWYDLEGEGLTGILSQHEDAWYYRRNLGGGFGAREVVATLPSVSTLDDPRQQLTDLDGNGQTDFVSLTPSHSGFYELSGNRVWDPFVAFRRLPNLDWDDPNLRLIDLTGDGHPDVLITEDTCHRWYPGEAEAGYAPGQQVPKAIDEERGPAIAFADATQSIILADMSGDGLTDIVRIRNGDVCYWPNTGYATFGAKVTMDAAPYFDRPEQFDPGRIRAGDIDGTGTTDVLYLGADGLRYWHNQAGNGWSEAHILPHIPPAANPASVQVMDVLGRGTACVVWTDTSAAERPPVLRYVPLMSSGKPYLLTEVDNGLGAFTRLRYVPSTEFYLRDRDAGQPWITRLPFPVHVLERVETYDAITRNRFVSRSAYHHGHFDGEEREFRGFGMVEQWDTEWFTEFGDDSLFPVGSNHLDEASHVAPVYTKTWFHNGFFMDREHISRQYAREYYDGDSEAWQLPDTELPDGLTAQEQREACRALKGRMLRQEVYGLDGERNDDPYSVVEAAFDVRRVQPRSEEPYAVFYVYDCETLAYTYEREPSDPRIAHTHTLEVDRYGNAVKTVAVAYPRRAGGLPEHERALVTYSEKDFIHLDATAWTFRTSLPFEQRSYEVMVPPEHPALRPGGPWTKRALADVIAAAPEVPHTATSGSALQKRLVGRTRVRYYRDSLDDCLPWGAAESLGIPCEHVALTFTQETIDQPELVGRVNPTLLRDGGYRNDVDGDATHWWTPSGMQLYDPSRAPGTFYLPTGVENAFGDVSTIGYDDHHLFPARLEDPLRNVSAAEHDYRVLAPVQLTGPNGNRAEVTFDTRGLVIATALMGKTGAADSAEIGDSVAGYGRLTVPIDEGIPDTIAPTILTEPRLYLQDATTSFFYDLFAWLRDGAPALALGIARETHASLEGGTPTAVQMSVTYSDGFGREIMTKVQAEDGLAPHYDADGRLVLDATGNPELVWSSDRWVGNGATVFNNKGLPVRQYEPFFDGRPDFTDADALVRIGVGPTLTYDPLGRIVRTDLPDGSFSRVQFHPWLQITHDPIDTVMDSDWYEDRGAPSPHDMPSLATAPDRRAAALAARHHDTPTRVYLDLLGRPLVSVAHVREAGGDLFIPTRTDLDIEGRPLVIYDGRRCEGLSLDEAVRHRGNRVMSYSYAIGGRELYQNSMDAGESWGLANVAGKSIHAWDARGHHTRSLYDELQRPTHVEVDVPMADGGIRTILAERIMYGESLDRVGGPDEAAALNLRGQIHLHLDGAGLVKNHHFDFKGNLLRSSRRLAVAYEATLDWSPLGDGDVSAIEGSPLVQDEAFVALTRYDALNRVVQTISPHNERVPVNAIQPVYNRANLLERIDVWLRLSEAPDGLLDPTAEPADLTPVTGADYNARGQRTAIVYGNRSHSRYEYDPATFGLTRLHTTRTSGTEDLQDLHYTYDPVGNLAEVRDNAITPVFFDNEMVDARSQFAYDSIYRLTAATGRESAASPPLPRHTEVTIGEQIPAHDSALRQYTEEYTYDSGGNITALRHFANGGNERREYVIEPDNNRLRSHADVGSSETYAYDAHGNVLAMSHLRTMEWDHKDQLQHVNIALGQDVYYAYAADRQRLRKVSVHSGFRDERLYLGGLELFRRSRMTDAVPKTEVQMLHVMDDAQRICIVETPTVDDGHAADPIVPRFRFQLTNHLGSATVELTETAQVISYEDYHPYGTTAYHARHAAVEVSPKRYRYTGMERDEETGLNYHTARYYAPWLGRWCSADLVVRTSGSNSFAAMNANPIRVTDRNGLDPERDEPPRHLQRDPGRRARISAVNRRVNAAIQALRIVTGVPDEGLVENPPVESPGSYGDTRRAEQYGQARRSAQPERSPALAGGDPPRSSRGRSLAHLHPSAGRRARLEFPRPPEVIVPPPTLQVTNPASPNANLPYRAQPLGERLEAVDRSTAARAARVERATPQTGLPEPAAAPTAEVPATEAPPRSGALSRLLRLRGGDRVALQLELARPIVEGVERFLKGAIGSDPEQRVRDAEGLGVTPELVQRANEARYEREMEARREAYLQARSAHIEEHGSLPAGQQTHAEGPSISAVSEEEWRFHEKAQAIFMSIFRGSW